MATNLTDALATLKKVTSGEGVVSMTAEALTEYANAQILKASEDEDGGKARAEALAKAVSAALPTFKDDPSAEAEVVTFIEPEKASEADVLENIGVKLDKVLAELTKATDNEAGNPTTTEVHPPPVPDGQEGGSIATAGEPEDDGTPRGELVKVDDAEASAEEDTDASPTEDEADSFVWPADLNTKPFAEGVTKNCDETRPAWGFDNEPAK